MGKPAPGKRYIIVVDWSRFQHYKDRRPPWIKLYLELRDNPSYLGLSGNRRGLLHGIWLEYAARCTCLPLERDLRCTCLPLDLHLLNRSLHLHAKMGDVEALKQAGFLRTLASSSIAKRKRLAPPEREVEKEKEIPSSPFQKNSEPTACEECGVGAGRHVTDCSHAGSVNGVAYLEQVR